MNFFFYDRSSHLDENHEKNLERYKRPRVCLKTSYLYNIY